MEDRPLRIAYLSDLDPRLSWTYSGGNKRILESVKKFGDVTVLSSEWHAMEPVRRLLEKLPESLLLRSRFRTHMLLSRIISNGVRRELARGQYDVLFASYSFHSLLNLTPPYPITTVFTSDATQTIYKQSVVGRAHGSFFSPARLLDSWIEANERKVLRNTDLLLWPSEWMKRGADERYGLSEEQSHLVPWGANIAMPPKDSISIENPMDEEVNLLLVGRDWELKGGPTAVAVLDALKARGIRARLTVIGCRVPDADRRPELTDHGYLDKNVPEQRRIFDEAFRTAHFALIPSFESYGFAFCEASAHAIPSLCLNVGGVPVFNGVNGFALPVGSGPEDFVARIASLRDDAAQYSSLRASSRQFYMETLNWGAWRKKVESLIREKVSQREARA
ncbi:glycosyltransferase [Algicella marina]|uniref:Glycosyltransferase n=1 Tax=Algicella marina TaxID=2683284 RepID=A0A6P1T9E4_9RHOB|nr:glycosyltransferase [Algicella marina]